MDLSNLSRIISSNKINYIMYLVDWLKKSEDEIVIRMPTFLLFLKQMKASHSAEMSCSFVINNIAFPLKNNEFVDFSLNINAIPFSNNCLKTIYKLSFVPREIIREEIKNMMTFRVEHCWTDFNIYMMLKFIKLTNAVIDEDSMPLPMQKARGLRNIPPYIIGIEINGDERPVIKDNTNIDYENVFYSIQRVSIPCPSNRPGCLVAYVKNNYTTHHQYISSFIKNKVNYNDLLLKWQIYYDYTVNNKIESIINKFMSKFDKDVDIKFPLWKNVKNVNIEAIESINAEENFEFEWIGPNGKTYIISQGSIFSKRPDIG